jgi:WD40 repeat protein
MLCPPSIVQSLAFTPDGRHLATGGRGDEPMIILWDLDTGRPRLGIKETHGPIVAIAFTADGNLMATAGVFERCVRIWDSRSAALHRSIAGHPYGTTSIAFSPDGGTLATAGNDGMVRLWTVATGRQLAALDGGATAMSSAAFFPAGRTLVATAKNDHDLRLWDLAELGPSRFPPVRRR